MKRIFKISALALAVIVMCLSFSGCAALEDMRDSHAVWTEKGNKDSITYNGEVYKLLNNKEGHNPLYNSAWFQGLYITEPDVPVLLSYKFGIDLQLSTDENFISGYLYNEYKTDINNEYGVPFMGELGVYSDTGLGREVYYCKEDVYDDMCEKIDAGINYTGYGYEYWSYDGSDEPYHYFYLSDEDAQLIDKIVEETKPTDDCDVPYEYMSICLMDEVSNDKSFGKNSYEVFYDSYDNYYLCLYSEPNGYDHNGKYTTYEVPDKYSKDCDRIFKNALENSEYS